MRTVVIDLDGTLANIDHRTHLVKRDKPLWDEFYAACCDDTVNHWCKSLMASMSAQSYTVLIVSARRDTEKTKTLLWLQENGVIYDDLIMLRKGADHTKDTELKRAWLKSYRKENILFVVDDRQKVVDMWREEGVVCLQCYAWPEFKREERRAE